MHMSQRCRLWGQSVCINRKRRSPKISSAISKSGQLINRGPKYDLYFLNKTAMPAILIEICFLADTPTPTLMAKLRRDLSVHCRRIKTCRRRTAVYTAFLFNASGKASILEDRKTWACPKRGASFYSACRRCAASFPSSQPEGTTGLRGV
jgi:hypothetical protein